MENRHSTIEEAVDKIFGRALPGGGYCQFEKGNARPDATAWAAVALSACNDYHAVACNAGGQLAELQLEDGRVPLIADQPAAYWPTFLSVFAWQKAGGFEKQVERAVAFLLGLAGKHWPNRNDDIVGHDTALIGWPWIENTHSWVEPTSLAIIALKICGSVDHERVREGVKMLMDRQLPDGGWNYGNRTVFNQPLLPMPNSTGHALCALSGLVSKSGVQKSIDYLTAEIFRVRSPLALCWGLFGLTAWGINPGEVQSLVGESFSLQKKYGEYNTSLLAQLITAYFSRGDFVNFLRDTV
jgi:hypothetical protein